MPSPDTTLAPASAANGPAPAPAPAPAGQGTNPGPRRMLGALRSTSSKMISFATVPSTKILRSLPNPTKFSSGSGRGDAVDTSASPIAFLKVRVIAGRDLVPKDKNGFSDPFVIIRFGDTKVESEVVQKSLNPVWGVVPDVAKDEVKSSKDATESEAVLVAPVYEANLLGAAAGKSRLEVLLWDRDKYKKDYMGEVSLQLGDWFGDNKSWRINKEADPPLPTPDVGYDNPKNKPTWHTVVSSRSRSKVSGEILIQIGLIAAAPSTIPPTTGASPNSRQGREGSPFVQAPLSIEQESELGEIVARILLGVRAGIGTDRFGQESILSAPATESVGTKPISEPRNEVRAANEIGIPDEEDEGDDDNSMTEDSSNTDSGSNTDDEGDDLEGDEVATPKVEPPEPSFLPAAAALQAAPPRKTALGVPMPNFLRRTTSSKSTTETLSSTASSGLSSDSQSGGAQPKPQKRRFGRKKRVGTGDVSEAIAGIGASASVAGTGVVDKDGEGKKGRKRRVKRSKKARTGFSLQTGGDDDIIGIVFVEVKKAENLPRMKNMTRTGYDMDPFVIVSCGQKIFRTRVIRHSLNPVWDERLFFHVRRHETKFQMLLTLFDWDKMTSNDFVGETGLVLSDLVSKAPAPDEKTGLYKTSRKDGKTGEHKLEGDDLHEFTLKLDTSKAELEDGEKLPDSGAKITFRAKFTPYAALRQQFWRTFLQQYDTDDTSDISQTELRAMLDSLGSTLSRETIESFWTRNNKQISSDALTFDQVILALESELMKPNSEKRHVDDSLDSGMATPAHQESIPPLGADPSGGGFGFTGPAVEEPEETLGLERSQKPLSGADIAAAAGANPTGGATPAAQIAAGAGMGSGVTKQKPQPQASTDSEDLEGAEASLAALGLSSGNGSGSGSSNDDAVEHVINIKACPLCHKTRLNTRAEVDIVTHLAVCASQDWHAVDSIVVGNFVTASQAQRKYFTKIIMKLSNGSYQLGANSANIIVQNRQTGQMEEEKMQIYVRTGIRLLYRGLGSNRMEGARIRRLLKSMSVKQGLKFDNPASAADIAPFIAFHRLNLDEILDPLDSFKNFNQFFYRKLKPEARPVSDPDDPTTLVSAADCRMMAFQTIDDATKIWIKGRQFSVLRLLGDDKETAKLYDGGSLCIFRLAPQDYHRYHSPVDGKVGKQIDIDGEYFTVNPIAIRSDIDVYGENVRRLVPMDSPTFGKVMNVCIGAMMVGSIISTVKEGDDIKRGEEYGYFAFGGSTIVTLFQPNTVRFDEDILINSDRAIETLVRVNSRIGKRA